MLYNGCMEKEKLEKMGDFFARRVDGYDRHMMNDIKGAWQFYSYTASLLPRGRSVRILDLGIGTGLEMRFYLKENPQAYVCGIDLSPEMMEKARERFSSEQVELIQGSYFDVGLPENEYDCAVSVESLHHFTEERKLGLYKKVFSSLKHDGYFVLTDYFAENQKQQEQFFRELETLKKENGIEDEDFYHFDTPLTVENEIAVLKQAGFETVNDIRNWDCTHVILAVKQPELHEVLINNNNSLYGLKKNRFATGEKVVFEVPAGTDVSTRVTSRQVSIDLEEYENMGRIKYCFIMPSEDVKVTISMKNDMTMEKKPSGSLWEKITGKNGKVCPECGASVSEDTKFCPECGRKLK